MEVTQRVEKATIPVEVVRTVPTVSLSGGLAQQQGCSVTAEAVTAPTSVQAAPQSQSAVVAESSGSECLMPGRSGGSSLGGGMASGGIGGSSGSSIGSGGMLPQSGGLGSGSSGLPGSNIQQQQQQQRRSY